MCNNSGGIRDRVCCTRPHVCADSVYEGGALLRNLCRKQTFPCNTNMGFIFMRLGSACFLTGLDGMAPSLRLSPASAISAGIRCAENAGNSGWQGLQSAGR